MYDRFDRDITDEELREMFEKTLELDVDLSPGDLFSDKRGIFIEANPRHKHRFLHDIKFPGMMACVNEPDPVRTALEFVNFEMERSRWTRDSIFPKKRLEDHIFEIKMWDECFPLDIYENTNGKNKVWDGLGDKEFAVTTRLSFHEKPLLTNLLLNKIQSKKKS